jgi:hypothetical protein
MDVHYNAEWSLLLSPYVLARKYYQPLLLHIGVQWKETTIDMLAYERGVELFFTFPSDGVSGTVTRHLIYPSPSMTIQRVK